MGGSGGKGGDVVAAKVGGVSEAACKERVLIYTTAGLALRVLSTLVEREVAVRAKLRRLLASQVS